MKKRLKKKLIKKHMYLMAKDIQRSGFEILLGRKIDPSKDGKRLSNERDVK